MEVIVQDANNIVIEVDQGRQGRGVEDVSLITVGADYYLLFTFTDGTTDQVGPIATTVTEVISAEVRNAEAVTILKGQPVYLFQAQGNLATVKLAFNTSDATSSKTLGLAAENIAPGAQGLITCQGTLNGLNTSAYNEGDTIYLGATAGTLTNVKPQAPNHLVYIGVVERANAGAGQIYVRVQNGFELDEIHDVRIVSPVNGNTLIYDATTSLWKNAGITAGSGINVTNGPASITVGNTGVLSFSGGTTGLTPATATTGAVSLAGTLSTANGGTGLTSFTANRVLYASSTSAIGQSASFTFDGSTLALNGGTIGTRLAVKGTGAFVGFDTGSAADGRAEYAYNGTNIFYTGIDSATEFSLWGRTGVSLKFAANNSEQMRLTSTGLGIGNSAPNTKLDITTTANNGIRLFQTGAANAWNIYTSGNNLRFIEENVGTVMAINAGGNVGIGTTSPAQALHVARGAGVNAYGIFAGNGRASTLAAIYGQDSVGNAYIWNQENQPVQIGTNNTERVRITAAGDVGIGTGSPGALLHLNSSAGGGDVPRLRFTNGGTGTGATDGMFVGISNTSQLDVWNFENEAVRFGTNNNERMRISAGGDVGINTISPTTRLDVAGSDGQGIQFRTASRTVGIGQISSEAAVYWGSGTALTFSTAAVERARIDTSGNLLVGTTTNTNSSRLTVNGTISETVSSIQYLVASQFDVGTAPNKIPLNQYLGNLAYQNASAIAGRVGLSAGTAALPSIGSATDAATGEWFPATSVMAWSTAGVERIRLDASGNLGVGLTNPSARVHASAADAAYQLGISGTTRGIRVETNATESRIVGVDQTLISSFQPISIGGLQVVIRTNGTTEAARFNSSGNLALGNITPSAWYTSPFIDIGQYGAIGNNSGGGGGFALYANAFEDTGGTFKYKQNYSAALYRTFAGAHQWFIAPSGTAGNAISFTQAMTLDANGRLLLGTTSGTGAQMDVQSAVAGVFTALSISNSSLDPAATTRIQIAGQGGNWAIDNTRAGAQLLFIRGTTEAARFTTANNQVLYQPAESAQNTSVTLTAANLQARIITSNAAVTLTLPTGTSLEGYTSNMATDTAFECTFIATTANAITIAANGNTTVGSLTVAGNTSGTFRFRKTAANTFTVYRVA